MSNLEGIAQNGLISVLSQKGIEEEEEEAAEKKKQIYIPCNQNEAT